MGYNVIVLDDLSGGFLENIPKGVKFVEGSITDNNLVRNLFSRENFDYVYHLAAYTAEALSHFARGFNYTNNLIGSINLINESVKNEIKCFVFTSSMGVYGSNPTPFTEDMNLKPENPYAISKYAVERDILSAYETFGLNYIIFRPHNVYGENQNTGDRFRNVIGIFMRQIMEGKPLTIFGDGTQRRAFSYIDDVAPYIADSVNIPKALNQTINIGGDMPCTINYLANIVTNSFSIKPNIQYLPERFEVYNAYSDHTKARSIFDIKNTIPLEVGINNMGKWVKEVGIRKNKPFKNIEIMKNIPPSWRAIIEK
jgi:UDP-glucose 4-epimerase